MYVSFEEFQRTILSREDVEVLDWDLLNTECRRKERKQFLPARNPDKRSINAGRDFCRTKTEKLTSWIASQNLDTFPMLL